MKSIIVAAVITVATATFAVVSFNAAPVQAGGVGDFYKGPYTCKAGGATTATASATNYDKGTGQEVHTSMKAGYINSLWFNPEVVYVNGVKRPAAEAYTYIADKGKTVNVKFVWGRGFIDKTCELYF